MICRLFKIIIHRYEQLKAGNAYLQWYRIQNKIAGCNSEKPPDKRLCPVMYPGQAKGKR